MIERKILALTGFLYEVSVRHHGCRTHNTSRVTRDTRTTSIDVDHCSYNTKRKVLHKFKSVCGGRGALSVGSASVLKKDLKTTNFMWKCDTGHQAVDRLRTRGESEVSITSR